MGKAANATKKKSPPTVHHPPYLEMIGDAISTLKERTGSSQQAIAKFIEDKHQKLLPPNFRKLLSLLLKNLVKSNSLYKVKNSYKLSSTGDQGTATTNKGGGKKKKKKIAEKTKRLSQVKTPEALKNKQTTTTNNNKKSDATKKKSVVVAAAAASAGGKVKRLSQVKTPEAMKKKKPNLSPMKRKTNTPNPKPVASSRPTRNARK